MAVDTTQYRVAAAAAVQQQHKGHHFINSIKLIALPHAEEADGPRLAAGACTLYGHFVAGCVLRLLVNNTACCCACVLRFWLPQHCLLRHLLLLLA
jgi:hypothetical protein